MFMYGCYIADAQVAAVLDTMRFVVEPDGLRRSHISLRGPYADELKEAELGRLNADRPDRALLSDISNFFYFRQSTVFLSCSIDQVEEVWDKASYADVRPHLTMYDGNDEVFARALNDTFAQFRWGIVVPLTPITKLERKKISTPEIPVTRPHIASAFRWLYGQRLNVRRVQRLKPYQRLRYAYIGAYKLHQLLGTRQFQRKLQVRDVDPPRGGLTKF